jgi:hypothetical protein
MTQNQQTKPPSGPDEPREWWDEFRASQPNGYGSPLPRGFPDLTPLIALVDALRRVVPLELQEQINALQRELLLTVRALIDWYLERLDSTTTATVVEDIPID